MEKITLVIHTPRRAASFSEVLNAHGINAEIESLGPNDNYGELCKILVDSDKLGLAVELLESGVTPVDELIESTGRERIILIPVDFASSSLIAVKVGFRLARKLKATPVVMHAYVAPILSAQSEVSLSPDEFDSEKEYLVMKETKDIEQISAKRMAKFKQSIRQAQNDGKIENISFNTRLVEGVAEESILTFCKSNQPLAVVMATRGVDRKEEDLIGSVTAEVIDTCRVPVLTVPENIGEDDLNGIKRLCMFCNNDRQDLLTIDALMKFYEFPDCEMFLIPVNDRLHKSSGQNISRMVDFLNQSYPLASFKQVVLENGEFRQQFDNFARQNKIELLIVPNKKTNVFSRIFRPTIAHKFLFERDMPMLAIPV